MANGTLLDGSGEMRPEFSGLGEKYMILDALFLR